MFLWREAPFRCSRDRVRDREGNTSEHGTTNRLAANCSGPLTGLLSRVATCRLGLSGSTAHSALVAESSGPRRARVYFGFDQDCSQDCSKFRFQYTLVRILGDYVNSQRGLVGRWALEYLRTLRKTVVNHHPT